MIDTGCKSERSDRTQVFKLWLQHVAVKVHLTEFCKIDHDKDRRYNLPDHGCPCTAFDSPFKTKNKQWVKNRIDNCTGQGTHHGIRRAAVGADKMVSADGQSKKRKTDGDDAYIVCGIRHNCVCRSEENEQRMQKKQNDRGNRYTGDDKRCQCTSGNFACFVLFAGAHFEIVVGCAADTEEQCGSS